jgi:hypothetical protein
MHMLAFRIVRATVLGLMFFLAVTAACSSDSYDPDPYDNVPPVVTVEFNYLVPSRVSVRRPNAQARTRRNASVIVTAQQQDATAVSTLLAAQTTPALLMGSPQLAIPLRR